MKSGLKLFLKNAEREITLLVVLAALVTTFSLIEPIYLSWPNLRDILDQTSIVGIIAIGMTFVMIGGGIDLSVGSTVALYGVITASLLVTRGVNPVLMIFIMIVIGAGVGLVNGLLVTKLRLQPFIATLGTMSLFRGVAFIVTGGLPVTGVPADFRQLIYGNVIGGIRGSIIIFFGFAIIAHILLKYTAFGSYLYAIGGNVESARLSGIKVTKNRNLSYMMTGIATAIAAIIMIARLGAGESTAGQGFELNAISAAAIGGASLAGGKGTIAGTVIGAVLLSALRNGLIVVGLDAFWQFVATGVVIIIAAYMEIVQTNMANKSALGKGVK